MIHVTMKIIIIIIIIISIKVAPSINYISFIHSIHMIKMSVAHDEQFLQITSKDNLRTKYVLSTYFMSFIPCFIGSTLYGSQTLF